MRIAVVGATGMVGSRVVAEALARGHSLTVIGRATARLAPLGDRAELREADVFDPASISHAVHGADLVVAAIRLDVVGDSVDAAASAAHNVSAVHGLLRGLSWASIPRLILVGGAGSLKVPPGVRFVDSPDFPDRFRPHSLAQAAGVAALSVSDTSVAWSCICPPFRLAPGERTGRYRVGDDHLLRDDEGVSAISAEDFAVAIVDEAERPHHGGLVFTVAY